MKNKFLVGFITFVITLSILIVVNVADFSSKKEYTFNRDYGVELPLKAMVEQNKFNKDKYLNSVNSYNLVVEYDKEIINEKETKYTIYTKNISFSDEKIFSKVLPSTSNLLYCDNKCLIYSNKLFLYQIDFKTNQTNQVFQNNNFVTNTLTPINEIEYLCFGELKKKNRYETGFYIVNLKIKKIKILKLLKVDNTPSISKNALMYSGKFFNSVSEDMILYYCDKYSKVYLFNKKNNHFEGELNTLDKTPKPTIATDSRGFTFYSRKGTWLTNMGAFIKDKRIYVFSASGSNQFSNKIVLDEYLIENMKYIKSYKLDFKEQSSRNIRNIQTDSQNLIIAFEYYYGRSKF